MNYGKMESRKRIIVGSGKKLENMTMTETARLILGLRAAGWTDKQIDDFILYIETGDDSYKPKKED